MVEDWTNSGNVVLYMVLWPIASLAPAPIKWGYNFISNINPVYPVTPLYLDIPGLII